MSRWLLAPWPRSMPSRETTVKVLSSLALLYIAYALVKPFSTQVENCFFGNSPVYFTFGIILNQTASIMENNTNPAEDFQRFLHNRNISLRLSKWITEKDVLAFLGIAAKTLRNWRSLRKIAYAKINGVIMYDGLALALQLKKGLVKRRG